MRATLATFDAPPLLRVINSLNAKLEARAREREAMSDRGRGKRGDGGSDGGRRQQKWAEQRRRRRGPTPGIPQQILQMGPPDRSTWNAKFNKSFGSWQRHNLGWNHTLLRAGLEDNPQLQAIIREHLPYFLPTWRKLCYGIMQIDVARAAWLYAHGAWRWDAMCVP